LVEPDPLPYSDELGGEINAVVSSNNRQGVISGILQGGFPKKEAFSWRVQGTAKRAGNSRTAEYYLKNTGLSEYNFSSSIGYRKAKFGAELFYSQFNTKIGIFAGSHIGNKTDFETALASNRPLPEYQSGFSYNIGRPFQDINHYLLKAQSYLISDKLGKFSLALGHQFNYRGEYDSHGSRGSNYNRPQLRFLLNTATADLTWDHKPIARMLTGTVGFSGLYQENDVKGRFLIPDFKNTGAGIYGVERFVKNQWEVEAGIRYDLRKIDIDTSRITEKTDPTLDFNKFTGTIGTTYKITPALAAKINVGMGWRPPSVNELFSDGIHHGEASYIKGQDSLAPETAYNFTASLSYKTVKFGAELDAYHYLYNNYIYQKPEFPGVLTVRGYFPLFVYTQTNALISGLDITGIYQFSHHLTWRSKYSMVRARNKSTQAYLPFFPADRFENTLRYHAHHALGVDNVYLSFSSLFVAKQWRVMPDSDYAPPPGNYLLFNTELGFSIPAVKGMDVGITVNNLLNTRYRDYLNRFRYYTDETGRNIHLRVKYIF
jgi:iron complex outermembrane receptor protein